MKALSFGEPEPEDREEKTTTANEEKNDTPNALESVRPSNKDEGFLQGVKSFVMAMSLDCTSMGKNMSEIDWKNAVLGAFMVEDEEVLQLMEIEGWSYCCRLRMLALLVVCFICPMHC